MDPRLLIIRRLFAILASLVLLRYWPEFCWVPLMLMMPVFGGVACSCCDGGTASSTYQIDLSGFTNNTCTDCADYNSSFIVTQPATVSLYTCNWSLSPMPGTLCDIFVGDDYDTLLFGFTRVGSDVDISVEVRRSSSIFTAGALWKETAIDPDPACTTFSARSIPIVTAGGLGVVCTHDGSAALVTSL